MRDREVTLPNEPAGVQHVYRYVVDGPMSQDYARAEVKIEQVEIMVYEHRGGETVYAKVFGTKFKNGEPDGRAQIGATRAFDPDLENDYIQRWKAQRELAATMKRHPAGGAEDA